MTHTTDNNYKERLQARQERLEREMMESRMRLGNNLGYLAQNGPVMIGATATEAIAKRSPRLARIVGGLGLGVYRPETRLIAPTAPSDRDRVERPKTKSTDKPTWLKLTENLIIPLAITLGQQQLLSFGLRRGGRFVGSALKLVTRGLFGKR